MSQARIAKQAKSIADQLIVQAIANGFEVTRAGPSLEAVGEGNTAMVVSRLRMSLSFIFKMDTDRKLVEEAEVIQRFRNDDKLPLRFRERFPRVFALKKDKPPYAYLMEEFRREDGFQSLSEALFKSHLSENALLHESIRLVEESLGALFEGYAASTNHRLLPNIAADYVDRIRDRLKEVAEHDDVFRSSPLTINGVRFRAWADYLKEIEKEPAKLQHMTTPFLCVVHGDPNPENILFRYSGQTVVDLKLIDPKSWRYGDYLFDVTKIAHYLDATGPIERALQPTRPTVEKTPRGGLSITYEILRPPWIQASIKYLRDRTFRFAAMHNDLSQPELRYQLGMASNLLGLPAARLRKGNRDGAILLYAEGLRWLDVFCRNLHELDR